MLQVGWLYLFNSVFFLRSQRKPAGPECHSRDSQVKCTFHLTCCIYTDFFWGFVKWGCVRQVQSLFCSKRLAIAKKQEANYTQNKLKLQLDKGSINKGRDGSILRSFAKNTMSCLKLLALLFHSYFSHLSNIIGPEHV